MAFGTGYLGRVGGVSAVVSPARCLAEEVGMSAIERLARVEYRRDADVIAVAPGLRLDRRVGQGAPRAGVPALHVIVRVNGTSERVVYRGYLGGLARRTFDEMVAASGV